MSAALAVLKSSIGGNAGLNVSNGTDSPLYQCQSGGSPTVNSSLPYCGVPGGAKRMGACCSTFNSGKSSLYLQGDCFVWCNVNITGVSGTNPLGTIQDDFSSCLAEGTGQDAFSPLACGKGVGSGTSSPSSTTQTTTSISKPTNPATPTTTAPSQAGPGLTGQSSNTVVGLLAFLFVSAGML